MLTDDEKWEVAGQPPSQTRESDAQSELEAARQRVNAYRGCGHPLVPTAVWLLGEVQRLKKLVELLDEHP
jgi:hypothetical protein